MKYSCYFNKLLTFWIVTFCSVTFSSAQRRQSQGEECNSKLRCDSRAFLTCIEGSCGCVRPDTMLYDSKLQRCSVLAGERCTFTALEGEDRSWSEEIPCLSNAQCIQGFCTCTDGFYETANGTCLPMKTFLEECESKNACNANMFLECSPQGKCECDGTSSTFDIFQRKCVRLAGASCDDDHPCVERASCEGNKCECLSEYFQTANGTCDLRKAYGATCELNEECMSGMTCGGSKGVGRCSCDGNKTIYDELKRKCVGLAGSGCARQDDCQTIANCGWTSSGMKCTCHGGIDSIGRNGKCMVSYESTCHGPNSAYECNTDQGLTCGFQESPRCGCKYGSFQTFRHALKKCVSEVDGPCDEDIPCVEHSTCVKNEYGGKNCKCVEGYIVVNGECQLTYGEPCYYTRERIMCDQTAPLDCLDGKCQCKPLQMYDQELRKCRGKVGALCSLPDETVHDINCITGARCVPRFSTRKLDKGICECMKGWRVTDGGICTPMEEAQTEIE